MYQFQPTAFVYQGDEKAQGEWNDSDHAVLLLDAGAW